MENEDENYQEKFKKSNYLYHVMRQLKDRHGKGKNSCSDSMSHLNKGEQL